MNKIALLITRIALIWFKTPKRYFVFVLGPFINAYNRSYLKYIRNERL